MSLTIRAALAAAALLAQLALPFAHGAAFAGLSLGADGGAAAVSAPSSSPSAAAHDPILCPACTALHHARSGIARVPAADALPVSVAIAARGREHALVLPRTPDLVAAAPRAPPTLPFAFA